jgi:hypothetical protein
MIKGDQIKKKDMSRTCSTNRRDEKCKQNLVRNPEGKRSFELLDIDVRMILKLILMQ